jgi:hypothetical protein
MFPGAAGLESNHLPLGSGGRGVERRKINPPFSQTTNGLNHAKERRTRDATYYPVGKKMWRHTLILSLILLAGCSTLFLSRNQLVGTYIQDGLIWGSMASMELRFDGSYLIGDDVVECVPDLEKESQYGVSYAKGTWRLDNDELVLTQSESHQGNFVSTGNFGNLRLRVSGSIFSMRLVQQGVKSPLVMKRLKGSGEKERQPNPPEPTPGSVKPAADAPIAPPSGAAHR